MLVLCYDLCVLRLEFLKYYFWTRLSQRSVYLAKLLWLWPYWTVSHSRFLEIVNCSTQDLILNTGSLWKFSVSKCHSELKERKRIWSWFCVMIYVFYDWNFWTNIFGHASHSEVCTSRNYWVEKLMRQSTKYSNI